MNLPTPQQCQDYFQKYKVPQNIKAHCQYVQTVANFLAKELSAHGEKIDIELVDRLSLLHDLFKMAVIKELKPNKHHFNTYTPEEIAMWKELRQKYAGKFEGEVAFEIFQEEFPQFALSLKNYGRPSQDGKTPEEKLVHYADWRVFNQEVVPLTQRLSYLQETYPHPQEYWEKVIKEMQGYEQNLFQKLSFPPEQLKERIQHDR